MTATEKPSSTPLLKSIFSNAPPTNPKGSNETIVTVSPIENNAQDSKEKGNAISNLFSSTSKLKLPDRPNNIPDAAESKKRNKVEKDPKFKIVKGGKKRMREKKRLEQEQENGSKTRSKKMQRLDTPLGSTLENVSSSSSSSPEESTNIVKEESIDKSTTHENLSGKASREDRTIFVGSLPLSISRKALSSIFTDCGKVETTRLRSVAAMGVKLPPQNKGDQNLMRKVCANTNQVDNTLKRSAQGYVVFSSMESVSKALKMNNTTVTIGNNTSIRLRVDTSKPTIDSTRSVFVGNLPYNADENELHAHFSNGCSNSNVSSSNNSEEDETMDVVEGVRIIRDPETMQCKGFGYVLLKSREFVVDALRLHDTRFMNRSIRVQICGKRYKGKRGVPDGDTTTNNGMKKKKKSSSSFEGLRSTEAAAKRISGKSTPCTPWNNKGGSSSTAKIISHTKKRRTYSEKNATHYGSSKRTVGKSKRAAAESKMDKRAKKLQKRISKGMGKAKK